MERQRITLPLRAPALALGLALPCGLVGLAAARATGSSAWHATLVGLLTLAAAGLLALVGSARELAAAATRRRATALAEALDGAREEADAASLLVRHAELVAPHAGAVLLAQVESDSRLDPRFGERISETPLRGLLVGHPPPESCQAIRLGATHARSDHSETVAGCVLCGRLAGFSTCEPVRAGERTLGALLVAAVDPIGPGTQAELRDAVSRAAPVIALRRTVAGAARHAGRDPLTGLINRRSAHEELERLCAQAGRSITPLAAVILDLDRFAAVNDRFGHTLADEVLTRVAGALVAGVRSSDVSARYGGQSFLVLAPDTDRRGGTRLAEKLRIDIETLELPAGVRLTTSCGVAALPEDVSTGDGLLHRAERALAVAKTLGRNRVCDARPGTASGPQEEIG